MKFKQSLASFICEVGQKGLAILEQKNCMPGGVNGPYLDHETPLRNTGHWLQLFAMCYKISRDDKYLVAVKQCAEFLINPACRPHGYAFFHRSTGPKDKVNGLIGPAWTFEALAEASVALDDERYARIGMEVYSLFPFCQDAHLWHIVEVDGNVLDVDNTFNHQLWFAMASASIFKVLRQPVDEHIDLFVTHMQDNMTVFKDGLIYHPIEHLKSRKKYTIKQKVAALRNHCKQKIQFAKGGPEYMLKKSIGYHSFNTMAISLLQCYVPDHKYWQSSVVHSCFEYLTNDKYIEQLDDNKFSYPYNPPGFEIPVSLFFSEGCEDTDFISHWINRQLSFCFSPQSGFLERNTVDGITLTARLYELTKLPLDIIEKIELEFNV